MRRAVFGNILTEAVTLLSRRDSSVRRELVRRRILQRKKKPEVVQLHLAIVLCVQGEVNGAFGHVRPRFG